jgi:DNA-binding transcriptional MerR regulator
MTMADLGEAGPAGPGRRPGKSAAAFRTISEVADELDVPQHVLRFWETKFPQIKPLKRGGGRRYYRPEDVDLLGRIRVLLYQEGYTIRGVQRLLREGGLKAPPRPADDADEAMALEFAPAPRPAAHGTPAAPAAGKEINARTRAALEEVLDELVQARLGLTPAKGQ